MHATDNARIMRAVGLVVARQAQKMAEDTSTSANDVIDLAPALMVWNPGLHKAGEVSVHGNTPYRCVQNHDSTGNPGWTPDATPALWSPFHATDAVHALPWRAPTGVQDAYRRGEWMVWTNGKAYRCAVETTVWGPDTRPSDWEVETHDGE